MIAVDWVKKYFHDLKYKDIYLYTQKGQLPISVKAQKKVGADAAIYVIINDFLFIINLENKKICVQENFKW